MNYSSNNQILDHQNHHVGHLVSGLCPPLLLVALLILTPAQLPSQGGPHKLAVSCHLYMIGAVCASALCVSQKIRL